MYGFIKRLYLPNPHQYYAMPGKARRGLVGRFITPSLVSGIFLQDRWSMCMWLLLSPQALLYNVTDPARGLQWSKIIPIGLDTGKFYFWILTNPMPGLPPDPNLGWVEAQNFGKGVLSPVDRHYERIVLVLEHAKCQDLGEGLCCGVKVSKHHVVASPPHHPDHVSFHSFHEELHGTSSPNASTDDIFWV